MNSFVVGTIVLVVYPLLQVPVIVYFARYTEREDDRVPRTPAREFWTDERSGEGRAGRAVGPTDPRTTPQKSGGGDHGTSKGPASGAVTCSCCGTTNGRNFAYCSECVTRLADAARA